MGLAIVQRRLQADNYMIGISKKASLIIHFFILLLISVSLFVSNLLHNCLRSLFCPKFATVLTFMLCEAEHTVPGCSVFTDLLLFEITRKYILML